MKHPFGDGSCNGSLSAGEDSHPESLSEALKWINAAFAGDPDDVRNWTRLEPLAPHANAVAQYADAANISKPTGRLLNNVGMLLERKALFAEAEPLYRRALAIIEKSAATNSEDLSSGLGNLGGLLAATNRYAEAEQLYRSALAEGEKRRDPLISKSASLSTTSRCCSGTPIAWPRPSR